MLDKNLLEILVCPKCKNKLEYESRQKKLVCQNCGLNFKIKGDIPILLLDED
jgi:uncharacterized protein YbaR (Trm112 family)